MPIIMCLTGANRQSLRDDQDQRSKLVDFLSDLNTELSTHAVKVSFYIPHEKDEAMYELWATEWVVQYGDLDVSKFDLEPAEQTLQGGNLNALTTLKEVQDRFLDFRAPRELERVFYQALDASEQPEHNSVTCRAFYQMLNENERLMRAYIRARKFSGTVSAGGGSSQVTLRRTQVGSLEDSQVHSLPLGNRSPLVSMPMTKDLETALFTNKKPRTRVLARQLLCGPGPVTETRPAWDEDGPVDNKRIDMWEELILACAAESDLPSGQRGLFVGISAVFYAAKSAKCDGRVMDREQFLEKLEQRKIEVLSGSTSGKEQKNQGRELANIVMVKALVSYVLHKTAEIVCKRQWLVEYEEDMSDVISTGTSKKSIGTDMSNRSPGPGKAIEEKKPDVFLATWTFGFYLKQSSVMAEVLSCSPE